MTDGIRFNRPVILSANKIDGEAVEGLTSTKDSLAYRIGELQRHNHSASNWFETAETPDGEDHVADRIGNGGNGSFQLDAGNDTWGSWVQILGVNDTPARLGYVYFHPHEILIENVERAAVYFIQLARGDTAAEALSNGTYTEMVYSAVTNKDTGVIDTHVGKSPSGSKVWARVMCPNYDTATLNFYIGIHEYEG